MSTTNVPCVGIDEVALVLDSLARIQVLPSDSVSLPFLQCQVRHILTDIIYLTKIPRLQLLLPSDEPQLPTDVVESAMQTAALWRDDKLLTDGIGSNVDALEDTIELAANFLAAVDEQLGSRYETQFLELAGAWIPYLREHKN
jgi:hypothetical protein